MKLGRQRSSPEGQTRPTEAVQALKGMGYAELATTISSTEGRQRIRSVWARIDEANIATNGIGRIFAGISQSGEQYLEVYGRDGLYTAGAERSVVVASASLTARGGIDIVTGERRAGTRNGEVPVAFDDSNQDSRRAAELIIRPALYGGTSSYYRQEGIPREYSGEVFPIASLQVMADFDGGELRTSMADNGETASRGIKINAAPYSSEPRFDPDDIAI